MDISSRTLVEELIFRAFGSGVALRLSVVEKCNINPLASIGQTHRSAQ